MTQHPVPQNVIEVEFKLFGSFTLKQFSRILIGALVGVVFFVLPLPPIIKFPLAGVSVIIGFGMAVAPSLGTWLTGFVKAMFVSPRYVWIRESSPPDILKAKPVAASTAKEFKVDKATAQNKIDISKVDLKSIYGNQNKPIMQTTVTKEEDTIDLKPDKVSEDNFVRVYEDVFGEGLFQRSKDSALNQFYNKEFVEKPKTQESINKQIKDYTEEINKLKFELSMIVKDENYKQKEEEILSRINDLYRELKILNNPQLSANTVQPVIKNQQVQTTAVQGKIVNGIVVDKKDMPIPNVIVSFVNRQKNIIYRTKSGGDGKFTTGSPIPVGTYAVVLEQINHKFHTYLVEVNAQSLPAFKFREK